MNLVKFYRKENNLTQEELSKLCGVSRLTIVNIEHGVAPRAWLIGKLSSVLHVSPLVLFPEDFGEPPATH